ncbi:DUF6515 family protein [Pedobacter sp. SYP-B3415]|uniref:DUF6515 family protein n=1 Tax=Pedobacter sp. SYP-B3415 TaxID=2496641 RepID=UPI00101CEDC0|nr:DUF6515 family protein [Pedobacter sp. SYP-B3415]
MKRLTKSFAAGAVALLLMAGSTFEANAQRPVRGGGAGPGGVVRPGGSGGYRPSTGIRPGMSYRGSIGMRFGSPFYNGFYGNYYRPFGPRIGFYLNTLPYGYFPFAWGADQFFYSNGYFFQPYGNGGYRAVNPPIGAEVPSLPFGAQRFNYEGGKYYEYNGVYYEKTRSAEGKRVYRVVGKNGKFGEQSEEQAASTSDAAKQQDQGQTGAEELRFPKLGELLNYLPDDARKITLSGKTYWVTPDEIYLEAAGQGRYKVVGLPGSMK